MLSLVFFLVRSILGLRYHIEFQNFEVFDTEKPVIVFPNHPGLVDPMIVMSCIGKKKILSPVMTETYIRTPGLGPILRALRTVPVGDLTNGGSIEEVRQSFVGIKEAIRNRQNILIYPSGHIYVQPFEHIVGKKMAYEIVNMLEGDARIIVLRTRGLWGSMWSKAYTGTSPELIGVLLRSVHYIFSNLVFFLPRRDVHIECQDMTDILKEWHTLGLDVFNERLQNYYNESGNEPCRYIPHYFYHDDTVGKREPQSIEGSIAEMSAGSDISFSDLPEDIVDAVITHVARVKKIGKDGLSVSTNLILDLHADSLDMAEFKSVIQSNYTTASNPPITRIKTIGDLAALALGKLEGEERLLPVDFPQALDAKIEFAYQSGDTILSCLRENFRRECKNPFLYDAMMGMLTRDAFLVKSYVIGEYIKGMNNEQGTVKNNKIGIMLPALSATSFLLVGTYLAGKVPVMLNWTVGEKSFAHCMDFSSLDTILTSRKFYEKIRTPWLAAFESNMVFIEDIVRDISTFTKLRAIVKKTFFLLPKTHEEAVILFTSGSESLPKAVVLTHANLLSDIEGALALVPFQKHETLLGILPPFHSFGFTINTIFPLIAPVQVAYTPDPGDARTIGKILAHTHASIVAATPTFLRMILSGNTTETLQSLRYTFVGAEKCSDEVFTLFHEKCPTGIILEGYGITECSPIVTVNPIEFQKKGSAGKFLPSLTPMIRSLDGKSIMSTGQQGMIYLRGPSIFGGYIDTSIESPFEQFDDHIEPFVMSTDPAERETRQLALTHNPPSAIAATSFQKEVMWYKTGDLGYTDADGFLFITGRLKRFVKIAGEMISLPFIETILLEKYGNPDITTLAIEAKEENGNVTIVAFTTFDVDLTELNNYIHTHGASNLVKITRVERIESIPVLGTGKTDYKVLKGRI